MKNETVTLSRELVTALSKCTISDLSFVHWNEIHTALAEPVPPAGGEPEVRRWFANWTMQDMFQHSEGEYVAYGDHREHVTRLQAELIEADHAFVRMANRAETLQSELTKARVLIREACTSPEWSLSVDLQVRMSDFAAHQSAPAAKDGE